MDGTTNADTDAGTGTGTSTAGAGAQAGNGQQTFTQEDVDRIVAGRVARENKGLEEIRAKAAKLDEIEAQNATDLEKAVAKAAADARAETLTMANTRLVLAEVKAAAAAAQFHDPGDAAALLAARFGEVKVQDDGQVDDAAVKALVEELAKSKPHLIRSANGGAKPLPGQGTGTTRVAPSGRDAGLAEARKRFGEPQKTT